jgi:hypothetical protein
MKLVHSPGFKGTRQNGRTPGTQNKTTKEVRELFKELLESNFETIEQDLQQLEPKDRINIILQLAKFVIPTLRAVEVKEDLNDNFTPIIFEFSE